VEPGTQLAESDGDAAVEAFVLRCPDIDHEQDELVARIKAELHKPRARTRRPPLPAPLALGWVGVFPWGVDTGSARKGRRAYCATRGLASVRAPLHVARYMRCGLPRLLRFLPRLLRFLPRLLRFLPRLLRFLPRLLSFLCRRRCRSPHIPVWKPRDH